MQEQNITNAYHIDLIKQFTNKMYATNKVSKGQVPLVGNIS